MNVNLSRERQELAYEKYASEYLASLPLEHFMESTDQSTQRKITLESLDLVHARRPEVQLYSELLVQYPIKGRRKPGQVVPDNMVVLSDQPVRTRWSFNVALEPAPPFFVLEYVSKKNPRKDYEDSFKKYEQHLKVPYCLIFNADKQDLRFYRHNKKKYVQPRTNRAGRYLIKEIDLQITLLDGWVRFWYQGELLPLPADLQRELEEAKKQAAAEKRRADELQQQLETAQRELADLRARLRKK